MIKLTLFANDDLANKATNTILQATKDYRWIDFKTSYANFFELYGGDKHRYDDKELNTHDFRVIPVHVGENNKYTDVATLFVAINFDNMPKNDIENSKIIDFIEVDESNMPHGFLFSASLSNENDRKIIVQNYVQFGNEGFAELSI